ncbi:hypothetical protein Q9Q95_07150 [Sphingomonas sp. DG1-23]|jgi:hypothetical protein|uniref:cupredoxin domain-containing protein n=1 Tax=Sphingomonas sp. DG1-23 TaxID=3068316 RepID=UPI00273E190C|nr:hypothetical protein [Sphingomonas sp. DG1-23]MDP5278696.1 hypothetical protein [Sphingomonas sp. DG1-23]
MRSPSSNRFLDLRILAWAFVSLVPGAIGWAALAPIRVASHEELFEIPRGTFAHRMAGERREILPQTIRLTVGLNDVLAFRNADTAPHIFGPTLIMPGQTFRLPFRTASTYSFVCTAHANGQLEVIVAPAPAPGWERFLWRWRKLTDKV